MIVAGTGHRPPKLGLGYTLEDRGKLIRFARTELGRLTDVTRVISGGAQGWDQALAAAARELKIPYVIACPFAGQDAKWPSDARDYYAGLLRDAALVQIVSPGPYHPSKFFVRDQWMVDHCDLLLALFDGQWGSGTEMTVAYARGKDKPIVNCWERWKV